MLPILTIPTVAGDRQRDASETVPRYMYYLRPTWLSDFVWATKYLLVQSISTSCAAGHTFMNSGEGHGGSGAISSFTHGSTKTHLPL